MSDPRPLSGVGLLELRHPDAPVAVRLASALAAKIMADLGARVVTLEPAAGDPARALPPLLPNGDSALFRFLNTGRTIIRAPTDRAARAAAIAILLRGDIQLVLAEEDETLPDRPSVTVAGWPRGMAGGPLSELTVLALGGLLDMIGDPAREPLRLGGHQGAYAAGLSAFTALMAQLAASEGGLATSPGRVSLIETIVWVNWKAVCGAAADGTPPTRLGAGSECQVVPCADGWIAVVFTAPQFGPLCKLVGDPRLGDPRFATHGARLKHGAALYEILRPWFATRSRDAVYDEAQKTGVPLGPVFSIAELVEDPQFTAHGFLASLDGLRLPQLPVRWNGRYFAPQPATTRALP